MQRFLSILAVALPALSLFSQAEVTLLFPNSDFEAGTLDHWTASGAAFSTRQPTAGDNPVARGRESAFVQGGFWVGSYENYDGQSGAPGETRGDGATGTLTSEEFLISRRYLSFRIGGGDGSQVGVKLWCEGEERVMATGHQSECMVPVSFDAQEWLGKTARIVVFDEATGGWGHINVDDFRGSDEPLPGADGGFEITSGLPVVDLPPVGYDQEWRPQFHFSSRRNWLNDPNGMVFDGESYHLFFQHNPVGTGWGNMSWGHATSPDMIHWRQHPHALLPYQVDGQYGTIYSGSAVVDEFNHLGVQVGSRKTLVAFYTFAGTREPFYQAMAYSTDGGVHWNYWNHGRAVVPNQGLDAGERDPKVFWHAPSQRWVMVLWVQLNPGRVRLLTSPNLTDWTFASDLERSWAFECMDLVPLAVDGDREETKWVIYDASFDYEIGSFDGTTFTTEVGPLHASHGNFYAAQSFNQAPAGRVVQMGWMSGGPDSSARYGVPFNQQMSIPCDLSLKTTSEGVRLCAWPVPELDALVGEELTVGPGDLAPGENALAEMPGTRMVDLSLEWEPGTADAVVLDLPGTSIRYTAASRSLSFVNEAGDWASLVDGPVTLREGKVRLRVLLDRLTLEAFVFEGEQFGSHYIAPENGSLSPSLRAEGGVARLGQGRWRSLDSSWSEDGPMSSSLRNPGLEEGLPAEMDSRTEAFGWEVFGGNGGEVRFLDDTGDAFPEEEGYPAFFGTGAVALSPGGETVGLVQSLGWVGLGDLGRTLEAGASLLRLEEGSEGVVSVSFRKGVTVGSGGSGGSQIGEADEASLTQEEGWRRLEAQLTLGPEDLGTEVFLVLMSAGDSRFLADEVSLQATAPAHASGALAYEGFENPVGLGSLSGGAAGFGWEGPWVTVNGGSADVVEGSLRAPEGSPVELLESATGNHAKLPNGCRVGRRLDVSSTGPFGQAGYVDANGRIGADGTTLYVSFLQQPDGTSKFYEFEFHRDDLGDSGRIAGIGNDQDGGQVALRAPNSVQTALGVGTTEVNLYVVRIDFQPGADDIRVYRNPEGSDEPMVPTLTLSAVADLSFNGISFGAFVNGRTVAHDEIRMAESWDEVVALDAYQAWGRRMGLGVDASFEGDADGDALANGLEWWLNGDPRVDDASKLMAFETDTGVSLSFEMAHSGGEGRSLFVQWSEDLDGAWTSVPIHLGGGTYPGGLIVETTGDSSPYDVSIRLAPGLGRRFIRLLAEGE
ncbi:sucrose-6-phosphate hydrolase SacC (GH32 family) [Haloferula luteola]|uniref:Sucrose-6-phosphate hydrolase SacC (GH32 family) n=1 Tax=Haloferula luteola TaxID=595692 RepID=A0A840VBZ5_9BACT|nr:glycoside hydrolase family 32 protein [Haloferula luteola]MBB5351450.1 sucrose-6-phosphate hydrolase SacC (GH32 family) [Haloferula luteola]